MTEQFWHNDGHYIIVRINKSELEVLHVDCPGPDDAECKHEDYGCLVRFFINRFGMECNAGSCPAEEKIDICWTIVGDKKNPDSAQVWFMPMKDDVFSAWLVSQGIEG